MEAQDRCRERLSGSACLGRLWVREVRSGAPGPETPDAVPPDSKDHPPTPAIPAVCVLRRALVAEPGPARGSPPFSALVTLQRPGEKHPARGHCWRGACPQGPGCWGREGLLTERRLGPLRHRQPGAGSVWPGSAPPLQFQGSLPARREWASWTLRGSGPCPWQRAVSDSLARGPASLHPNHQPAGRPPSPDPGRPHWTTGDTSMTWT